MSLEDVKIVGGTIATKSKCKLLLALLVTASTYAMGEIKSGTAIVIFYSKQRVVIAGESRVILVGKTVGSRDDECKVFALDKRFVFAASGMTGHYYLPGETGEPWSALQEAFRLAATIPKDSFYGVGILVHRWGEWMRGQLDTELAKNEAQVLSHRRSPLLASAIFAGRDKSGELSVYSVALTCACDKIPKRAILRVDKQAPTENGLPVAIFCPKEATPVFYELIGTKSERAKAERVAWTASLPQDTSLAHDAGVTIRTLEFVLRYSGAPDIGGPIDAVALESNGKIQWIQRKANCLPNQ